MIARDFKINILPVSKKLLRCATHFLKNEDEAKDAVQDVFLKLWQKRDELEKIENVEAYAMQMTKNRCLDVIKANRTIPINAQTDRNLKEESADVHLQIEYSESANLIKKLIKKLPDLQQKIMYMRDIEQFSYEEIAETTELQINAIRVNLSRARKKVRDEFLKLDHNGNQQNRKITSQLL